MTPLLYYSMYYGLKEEYKNLGVSVTEITRITGKSRSTIYKVLKKELGYISNWLVKNDR